MRRDTIVAAATPPGSGALAVVRLSGAEAVTLASRIIKESDKIFGARSRRLFLVDILLDDGSLLDRALCAVFREPHSYTGENVVEFFLHGSPFIVTKTIDRCCQQGARPAEPGEFTLRAFLNGRMDLAQAEAVADLVAANSAQSHRAAIAQREGHLSKRLHEIRTELLEICSLVEMEIDFTDQDVPVIDRARTEMRLKKLQEHLQVLVDSFQRGRMAREGAVVVIAGAPNVGKSTLFNGLLGEERAIVHKIAGTTRDTIEAVTAWRGLTIRLVDSAGWAEGFQGPDAEAVERARRAARGADLVLWVFDLTEAEPIFPPDELLNKAVIVGNKADLVRTGDKKTSTASLTVSALVGEGMDDVKAAALQRLLPLDDDTLTEGVLTRARHVDAVQRAMVSLENAQRVLEADLGYELLAEDIRVAAGMLGEIIGNVTPDEVLHKIFADFCVGK